MRSLIVAFSLYSRIPMPHIEWTEKSMRYAFCWFPTIGMVIGALIYFTGNLIYGVNTLLFAAVMTVLPVIITGGIHLDGFIDTADALSSYGDRNKRLEIMKDPHIGAFAVIWTAVYFILSLGVWSEAVPSDLLMIGVCYIMSRALSALAIVSFKTAKSTGLASMFADAADKTRVRIILAVWAVLSIAAAVVINTKQGIIISIAAAVVFVWHYYNCRKNFGGITGDLAGAFLQVSELAMTAAVILG